MNFKSWLGAAALSFATACPSGCSSHPIRPGDPLARRGDEIVVCGRLFHTGAPVVLWTDPGGYDAYRTDNRFGPLDQAEWAPSKTGPQTPNRYGLRTQGLSEAEIERVRGGGWDLALLQRVVDQFVIHYDACGTSRECFRILHDVRGLSVHFMLDVDGTIYQTLDLKERAWHATIANDRSIGIEIANIGAYPPEHDGALGAWYGRDAEGRTVLTLPPDLGDGGIRTAGFIGRPSENDPVRGVINGRSLVQYDLTPQQYDSLIRLTAALCRIFPRLKCDYPKDDHGNLIRRLLTPEEFADYHGLLGHFHIQQEKVDPGPAFRWRYVVTQARRLMRGEPIQPDAVPGQVDLESRADAR